MQQNLIVPGETVIGPKIDRIAALISSDLAPNVTAIDLDGEYPSAFLQALGRIGGFAGVATDEVDLRQVIETMEAVSRECMSTGFLVWCQSVCAWYLRNSSNAVLRSKMLPAIASGEILAGTGLSNPMKSSAAIEDIRLQAKKVAGGYLVNGSLPWVSNIGPGHFFASGAGLARENGLLIALVACDTPGLTLNQNAHFVALEGANTFPCHFKDVFIANDTVIAHPQEFGGFVARIKSGFVLNQMGMGLGLADACVAMMKQSNKTLCHVNCYLDDQADDIAAEIAAARAITYNLAAPGFRRTRLAGGKTRRD